MGFTHTTPYKLEVLPPPPCPAPALEPGRPVPGTCAKLLGT